MSTTVQPENRSPQLPGALAALQQRMRPAAAPTAPVAPQAQSELPPTPTAAPAHHEANAAIPSPRQPTLRPHPSLGSIFDAPSTGPLPANSPILNILPRLNLIEELRLLDFPVMRGAGDGGWLQCTSIVDGASVAMIHPVTGFYQDSLLGLESLSFSEFLLQFWNFSSAEVLRKYLLARANGEKIAPPNRRPQLKPMAPMAPIAPIAKAAEAVAAQALEHRPVEVAMTPEPRPEVKQEVNQAAADQYHAWCVAVRAQSVESQRLKREAILAYMLWEKSVELLNALIDGQADLEPRGDSAATAPVPLTGQFAASALAKPLDNVSLIEMGLTSAQAGALQAAGVASVGALHEHIRADSLTSLPKIGKAKAASIVSCVRRFLEARDQYERETRDD